MIFMLGDVFRRKGPRGKCVRITGTTAGGGILVRPCNPDGSNRGVQRRRLMWPGEFDNDYVKLPVTFSVTCHEESVVRDR